MKRIGVVGILALGVHVSALTEAAEPAILDNVTVMALGALDSRAVINASDGKMHVLKLGDTIPGTAAIVTQVHTDKLVVEESVARDGGTPAKQTVWILKPAEKGEK